jgi:hypothetical protein
MANKILGKVMFDVELRNGKYHVNGGSTRMHHFGWANREETFNTKEEAIEAIIKSVRGMGIKDAKT